GLSTAKPLHSWRRCGSPPARSCWSQTRSEWASSPRHRSAGGFATPPGGSIRRSPLPPTASFSSPPAFPWCWRRGEAMRRGPATVITGFLGAGKTSLVRHLLARAQGRRLAVLVNEFGELGIDRELLLGCGVAACAAGDIVELANGCLCCTVADD